MRVLVLILVLILCSNVRADHSSENRDAVDADVIVDGIDFVNDEISEAMQPPHTVLDATAEPPLPPSIIEIHLSEHVQTSPLGPPRPLSDSSPSASPPQIEIIKDSAVAAGGDAGGDVAAQDQSPSNDGQLLERRVSELRQQLIDEETLLKKAQEARARWEAEIAQQHKAQAEAAHREVEHRRLQKEKEEEAARRQALAREARCESLRKRCVNGEVLDDDDDDCECTCIGRWEPAFAPGHGPLCNVCPLKDICEKQDKEADESCEKCVCKKGFELGPDGTCVDVDECLNNNGGCDPRVRCINRAGGHKCGRCPSGYLGSGYIKCFEIRFVGVVVAVLVVMVSTLIWTCRA